MQSIRRVRFSKDTLQSSEVAAELIENQREKAAAHERSLRSAHLENVRLAAQRAHDAVMLARSMQADIRNGNAKLQKSEQVIRSEGTPQVHTESAVTQSMPSTEKRDGPLLLDILKEQDIVAVPIAWISNMLLINK
jgi:hypothetical protein